MKAQKPIHILTAHIGSIIQPLSLLSAKNQGSVMPAGPTAYCLITSTLWCAVWYNLLFTYLVNQYIL